MAAKSRQLFWFAAAAALFAGGFFAAALWDLPLSRQLYAPAGGFAVWMECFGWYVAFVPPLLLAALYLPPKAGTTAARPRWQGVLAALALAGTLVSLAASSFVYMQRRGWASGLADGHGWLWQLAALLPLLALVVWAVRLCPAAVRRLRFAAFWGCVLLAAAQLAVQLLKLLWQRTRFDTMVLAGEGFAAFTPWYRPLGNGGSSFPSNHTANAAFVFLAGMLWDLWPLARRRLYLLYAAAAVYTAAMGAARIFIGRHFLSDVLAGSLVVLALYAALRRLPAYRRGCQKLQTE